MVAARDELNADGLVLTTEINRRDARHTKQRAQLMSDLDDRRCAQSACGMACLRHGHVTYTLCDSCVGGKQAPVDARATTSHSGLIFVSMVQLCARKVNERSSNQPKLFSQSCFSSKN